MILIFNRHPGPYKKSFMKNYPLSILKIKSIYLWKIRSNFTDGSFSRLQQIQMEV